MGISQGVIFTSFFENRFSVCLGIVTTVGNILFLMSFLFIIYEYLDLRISNVSIAWDWLLGVSSIPHWTVSWISIFLVSLTRSFFGVLDNKRHGLWIMCHDHITSLATELKYRNECWFYWNCTNLVQNQIPSVLTWWRPRGYFFIGQKSPKN